MSRSDTSETGGRPHIRDKWGAVPPPVPTSTARSIRPDEESVSSRETVADPVIHHSAERVSRRSRVICLMAAGLSLAVSFLSTGLLTEEFARAYSPPHPVFLIVLSLLWTALEFVPLYALVRGNGVLYVKWTKRMLMAGPSLMALGRFGLGLTAIRASAVVLLPMVMVLPALSHLFGNEHTTSARRWFFYLLSFGLGIQFACAPSDGIAQVRAIGLSVMLLGFIAPLRPARLLSILDDAGPRRLATALWWISGLVLTANAGAKFVTGSATPGISVGGVGIAPYWIAVFPILTAVGIELREGTAKRLGIGLGLMVVLYVFGLKEGGTALMVLIAALLVTAVLGSGRQVLVGLTLGTTGYLFLKTGWAASVAGVFSDRIASRLSIWHGLAFNAQLASYYDVVSMSGWTGFCGAARSSLLIPAASKDFILGAIVAETGLVGLVCATAALAFYLLEIGRSVAAQDNAFRRAAGCGVWLALCASLLVSYAPTLGWLMPTGLPLPALSRGAAVTVAACLALIVFEWLNWEESR
ncbi:MAG: hypothetical protein ABFD46_05095 [Armatimonadota bacterium]